jgi:hypothetical protein
MCFHRPVFLTTACDLWKGNANGQRFFGTQQNVSRCRYEVPDNTGNYGSKSAARSLADCTPRFRTVLHAVLATFLFSNNSCLPSDCEYLGFTTPRRIVPIFSWPLSLPSHDHTPAGRVPHHAMRCDRRTVTTRIAQGMIDRSMRFRSISGRSRRSLPSSHSKSNT